MNVPLRFKPFDERDKVRIYYSGCLPHWRQAGCTYFVTFRLADSIPLPVLKQWEYERNVWLAARRIDPLTSDWKTAFRNLPPHERQLFERHFASTLFEFLARGEGECVLRDPEIRSIVVDALSYFHSQRLDTGDFAVMPNHVHALMTPYSGFELERVLHSIKSYTAKQINQKLGRSGPLWMEESYDHIVRDGEELLRIQSYIRANPEKAGLGESEYSVHMAEYDLKY
jgi:type I restriction enzyme R subunit